MIPLRVAGTKGDCLFFSIRSNCHMTKGLWGDLGFLSTFGTKAPRPRIFFHPNRHGRGFCSTPGRKAAPVAIARRLARLHAAACNLPCDLYTLHATAWELAGLVNRARRPIRATFPRTSADPCHFSVHTAASATRRGTNQAVCTVFPGRERARRPIRATFPFIAANPCHLVARITRYARFFGTRPHVDGSATLFRAYRRICDTGKVPLKRAMALRLRIASDIRSCH